MSDNKKQEEYGIVPVKYTKAGKVRELRLAIRKEDNVSVIEVNEKNNDQLVDLLASQNKDAQDCIELLRSKGFRPSFKVEGRTEFM